MQTPEISTLPLRDIKLPAEPGFWPLAPGWWVLLVVVLLLMIWLANKYYKYKQKKQRWLDIDQQLSQLEFDYKQSQNSQKLLTEVSVFLRRFVKHQLHQDQATSLAGKDWIKYLSQYPKTDSFDDFEAALTVGVYQVDFDYDSTYLLKTTRDFIKQQVMKPVAVLERPDV